MPKMTPSEAMAEVLVQEGVNHVSGILGSAFMDLLDLFPAAGIEFISVRHEQTAGHMEDAYCRMTGKAGVCIGQNGPGITNYATAVATAGPKPNRRITGLARRLLKVKASKPAQRSSRTSRAAGSRRAKARSSGQVSRAHLGW